MTAFVVAGTDTGIGKTVFAAALTGAVRRVTVGSGTGDGS